MWDHLSHKLQEILRKLTGRGVLTEAQVAEACREIRLALLEADVNFRVARNFVARISERAVGAEVRSSLTPGQQVVKIVKEELTALLGGGEVGLEVGGRGLSVLMLVGLQGGGKTTTAGKLGLWLRRQGKRPLLVGTDVRRPAAVEQLRVIGRQLGLPVFDLGQDRSSLEVARRALGQARGQGCDVVILDTQGRLHVDEELMAELGQIKEAVSPQETLLVLDAMTGQDAVNAAARFDLSLEVTGFVLTKLDGDARGGAALSIRAVTGKPIKFVGTGEKPEALEPFHPDRMASRILGMGDVLTLIEQAESTFSEKEAEELERKLRSDSFDLNDFLTQLQRLSQMSSLEHLLGMVPGLSQLRQRGPVEVDRAQMGRMAAIIQSMTPQERAQPQLINGSRRRRIARGSGTQVHEVNQLLGQYRQMRAMLTRLARWEGKGKGARGGLELPAFR